MGKRVALIMFARVPYVGAVKTRLAKDIGSVAATKLYRTMLNQAVNAASGSVCQSFIAWTPDDVFFHLNTPLPSLQQGGGDLGQRLTRLAKKFAPVIFIGSDSLAMTSSVIDSAVRGLQTHDLVAAPAGDGGYSLLGLNNGALRVFDRVRWSHAQTLNDTLKGAKGKRILLLPRVPDIDCAADLVEARHQLG